MNRIIHEKWKRLGRNFAINMAICLPFAWIELHYWLEEPYTVKRVIFKGLFMALWFTILLDVVFAGPRKRKIISPKTKLPHES